MEVALGCFEDDGIKYDLSKPPMSGMDYLKRVQMEAADCPDVVIVKPPTPTEVKSVPSQNVFMLRGHENHVFDKTKFYPSEKSQLRLAEDFAYLRQRLNRAKADPSLCSIKKSVSAPTVGSSQVYARFCYGKDFAKQYIDAGMKGEKGQLINSGALGQGNSPLLSILLKMKQSQVIRLLHFNSGWLDVLGFSYDQGCWIHGLLMCIDKPMPSDVTATLRELCRRSIAIRNDLTDLDEGLLHQLNLIIVLVTRYFGQVDLVPT